MNSDSSINSDHAFEMRNVARSYSHFEYGEVSLAMPNGCIMGLIGPNGAGKSTTIRILMGLIGYDSGSVAVLGNRAPEGQVAAKREIGYVSEDMSLYPSQTLSWHMQFLAQVYPTWDQRYADHLVQRFDLVAEQKLKGFSHGQSVKAKILLALAHHPKLLILDEPTTGLDPVARAEINASIMEVLTDESRSILFSSHNTQDVEQLSDQITFINRGKIISSNDKESFLENWRRIRINIGAGGEIAELSDSIEIQRSGSQAVITTNRFAQSQLEILQRGGAELQGVERMTLEEIFVAQCKRREISGTKADARQGVAA